MEMYEQIKGGNIPPEIAQMQQMQAAQYNDENGNPIIDEEGGAVIQPIEGFVVKTRDQNGEKVFVNMTHHSIVEGFQEQAIPAEDAAKLGTSPKGVRIPLSLGPVREDRDKKGDPVRVYDFIWATETVKKAQIDAMFRQQMVELAFTYITQKFQMQLDLRFTIPKMKYKGSTIQFQRVKAKRGPKIQEVQMTEEERNQLEEKAMDEERRREALREKEPKFNLYSILHQRLNKDFSQEAYIQQIVKESFENDCVGDEADRWTSLIERFQMKEQLEVFEEFDGLNSEEAHGLLLVVQLPLLARGHAIQCHVLGGEHIMIQVPNMYNLKLGLPFRVEANEVTTYFDCKIRRLFVHAGKTKVNAAPSVEEDEQEDESELVEEEEKKEPEVIEPTDDDGIVEIDTDDYFQRDGRGKVQAKAEPVQTKTAPVKRESKLEEEQEDDDLLFGLC